MNHRYRAIAAAALMLAASDALVPRGDPAPGSPDPRPDPKPGSRHSGARETARRQRQAARARA